MKKKRLAALAVALALVLSLSVSVLALNGISIGDVIGLVDSVDMGSFPSYNETSWNSLSIDERRSALEDATRAIKGTPHFDNDFLNTSQAYDYYQNLIKAGNSVNFVTAPVQSMYGAIMLERAGQADFGLGFYNDNGHSGGKFGDNTVADSLNDDFLDYIQKYPYVGQDTPSTAYKFSNGYYVDWDPLDLGAGGVFSYAIDGVTHKSERYGLRFYLHDETGKIIDMVDHKGYNAYTPLLVCDVCGGALFDNFTITSEGQYYFDYHPWDKNHRTSYFEVVQSAKYQFPWWSQYGTPTEEPVVTDPVATGTDENGNEIQFNINSDGVTYEGNTYNYNDDNSVTINGNTYHITVNPADVNEDYYNQFLQQIINSYYNYYGTDETPFDGTDILTSLKSIFDSLEKFRSSCYTQLKETADYIFDGFNSMRSSLKTIIDKLKDIIDQLKDIGGALDDISEEKKQEYNTKWLEAIGKVKKKFCYDEIKANIDNCYNAMFNAEYSETEQAEVIATYAYNDGSGADPIKKNGTFLPAITVEIFGQEYNLLSCIGSFTPYMDGIKDIISMFLIITFILSLFRSLPAMIGGVSSVVTSTPQFQDFSDKTEVEFYRSKYDR